MSRPRRENLHLQERVTLTHAHAQLTGTATEIAFKASRDFILERVRYVNDTGLAAHAANFFALQAKNGAVVMADWSTEVGEEGTVAAATFVDLTNSAVVGALNLAADDVLSFVFTESGTATLPPGKFLLEGRYL